MKKEIYRLEALGSESKSEVRNEERDLQVRALGRESQSEGGSEERDTVSKNT